MGPVRCYAREHAAVSQPVAAHPRGSQFGRTHRSRPYVSIRAGTGACPYNICAGPRHVTVVPLTYRVESSLDLSLQTRDSAWVFRALAMTICLTRPRPLK